jgi:hypothetical protein
MRRFGIAGLAMAGALAGAAPAVAAEDPFAGDWAMAQRFFPGTKGRLLLFLDTARSRREGGIGHARMLVIDEASAKGIRSNLIDYSFDCTARTYRRVGGSDYDSEGRVVTGGDLGPPMGPVVNNSLASVALDHSCFGEMLWLVAVDGPVQNYADEVFAASPALTAKAENDAS